MIFRKRHEATPTIAPTPNESRLRIEMVKQRRANEAVLTAIRRELKDMRREQRFST